MERRHPRVHPYRCVLPDGTSRVIHSIAHPVFDDDGGLVEYMGMEMGITERKRAEEALRESELRLRTFVDHAGVAFHLHDNDDKGRILDVNREARESLGYAREDGTHFPVEVHIRQFHHGGRRLGVSLCRDITERKQAERALNESYNLLRAVVEGSPDPIYAKVLQGRYRMINSGGARALGKTVEEVIGREDHALLPPDAARAIREQDLRILVSGDTVIFEEALRTMLRQVLESYGYTVLEARGGQDGLWMAGARRPVGPPAPKSSVPVHVRAYR